VLHVGGNEGATGVDKEGYGSACYIRNCFVDAAQVPMSADVRAFSMGWCHAGVIEGSQAHNVRIGGPYQDKATTREIVVRNNSYRNVIRGSYWKLGVNAGPAQRNLSALTSVQALATATLTAHGFDEGDRIKIDAGGGAPEYKGVFLVKQVLGDDQFTYQMQAVPQGPAGSSPNCRKVFGVANILVERNIIELATGSGDATSKIGIYVDDGRSDVNPPGIDTTADTPEYVYTEAIVRENRIRYLDAKFDATWSGEGVRVSGVKNAIVRDNVIECAPQPSRPIKNFRCGTVKYFNNKTPAGVLIQGFNGLSQLSQSELETEADDALVLTLI